MSSSAKPTIDKSKLLALAKNVTKSKLIAKNNNNSTQPIKVHRRTASELIYNDISLSKEKTKLVNARIQNIMKKTILNNNNINENNENNDNHLSIKSESNVNINKGNVNNLKNDLNQKNIICQTERYNDYKKDKNNKKDFPNYYNNKEYNNYNTTNEKNDNNNDTDNESDNEIFNSNRTSHNGFMMNYLKKKNFAIEKEFDIRTKLNHNSQNNINKFLKNSFSNSSFKSIYLSRVKSLNESETNKSSYRELRKIPNLFSSSPHLPLKTDISSSSYFPTEESINNKNIIIIRIEDLIVLEEKMSKIIDSFKCIKDIRKYCIDWYTFYNYTSFKGNFENFFDFQSTQKSISHETSFLEFLSIIIIYESFGQATITQTAISKLNNLIYWVHQNFLIECDYILTIFYNNNKSNVWVNKLQNIVISKKNRKTLKNEHINILKEGNYNILLIIKNLLKMFSQSEKMNISTFTFYLKKIKSTPINTLTEYFKKKINQSIFQSFNYMKAKNNQNNLITNMYHNDIISIPYLQNRKDKKKYFTLVLDLDETLISYQKDEYGRGIMKPRPHLHSFLLEMYKYYELIVFTAGTQEYADPILNIIDKKNNIFDKRLYRQHAIIVDESFVKDLSLLGRDLKKVIILDNNPHNYDLQKENGIFIKSFYGEKDDNVLVELIPILQKIASNKDNDVRVELLKLKDEIFTKITTNLKE